MSSSAGHGGGRERPQNADRVRVELRRAREMPRKDLLIRFFFGAGVSLLAAVVSKLFGPFIGGVFLAFPAILLASLTLRAKEEGLRSARDDARGAALGTIGLLAFALTAAVLLRHHSAWLALAVATAAWTVVSRWVCRRPRGRSGRRRNRTRRTSWLVHSRPAPPDDQRPERVYTSMCEPMMTVRSRGRPKYSAASAVM